ncbi:MAG TPA: HD domain-containing protein [Rhizomicrobium sp.]|nr:HD domain-containing protein [Rhizomicrobium sp.]
MTAEEVFAIYGGRGAEAYFGEKVTVTEHCLQAAHFAHACGASDPLVLAALLHDIGHLIAPAPDDIADWKTDAGHEHVGAAWLLTRFGLAVSEPVRLHVHAKRYLCAREPDHFATLSPASVTTLGLQGGPMSPAQMLAFEAEPYFRDAVGLRRWDDQAKIAGFPVPDLAHYRPLIERLGIGQCGHRDDRS